MIEPASPFPATVKRAALIVAGGSGQRFGTDTPKQYLDVAGKPLLRWTVEAFRAHPLIDVILVVIGPAWRDAYDRAVAGLDLPEPMAGGATRQDSVRAGLEALAALPDGAPDQVLIHDAARPCVGADTLSAIIEALDHHAGAIAAVPVVDTLKRADDGGRITDTVPRNGLWRAQTPQAFALGDILSAHRDFAGHDLTDDAAVAERAGMDVVVVMGAEENIKVTRGDDLARAAAFLTDGDREAKGEVMWEPRMGTGYDVHRFGNHLDDGVTLCGIRVPHPLGLAGHSDADVALHALTDALLGAICAGDIGHHFPPGDPEWKGAESRRFLEHAAGLVRAKGARIVHVDVTIICERPKVGPHREAMRARVAEILGIEVDRVSVKATTTEKLGFTGRGEGIAAQAAATVLVPV